MERKGMKRGTGPRRWLADDDAARMAALEASCWSVSWSVQFHRYRASCSAADDDFTCGTGSPNTSHGLGQELAVNLRSHAREYRSRGTPAEANTQDRRAHFPHRRDRRNGYTLPASGELHNRAFGPARRARCQRPPRWVRRGTAPPAAPSRHHYEGLDARFWRQRWQSTKNQWLCWSPELTLAVAYSNAYCEVLQSISLTFGIAVHAGSPAPPHG
jgi:hypothetical protein